MDTAPQAAPEIDRLVLSVNAKMNAEHGQRLTDLARQVGLDSLYLLPHLGNFMLAGTLTPELAVLRLRYAPPEQVQERLYELKEKTLLTEGGAGLGANPELRTVLEAINEAVASSAGEAWDDHETDVAEASAAAKLVADAARNEHVVAVSHREAPEPDDPYLRLHQRLVTLRFVRQHDHAEAWLAHGLTPADMVVMTPLWNGESVDGSAARLAELGHAEGDPPRLTSSGRAVRDAIEDETNRRAQQTFDVLDDAAAARFVDALRRIPGVVA
ncbi:MAG: helix-turn-helix domain-containing protein [Acidimicrobiia bacterium]